VTSACHTGGDDLRKTQSMAVPSIGINRKRWCVDLTGGGEGDKLGRLALWSGIVKGSMSCESKVQSTLSGFDKGSGVV
jgi:hypothetical protein